MNRLICGLPPFCDFKETNSWPQKIKAGDANEWAEVLSLDKGFSEESEEPKLE